MWPNARRPVKVSNCIVDKQMCLQHILNFEKDFGNQIIPFLCQNMYINMHRDTNRQISQCRNLVDNLFLLQIKHRKNFLKKERKELKNLQSKRDKNQIIQNELCRPFYI